MTSESSYSMLGDVDVDGDVDGDVDSDSDESSVRRTEEKTDLAKKTVERHISDIWSPPVLEKITEEIREPTQIPNMNVLPVLEKKYEIKIIKVDDYCKLVLDYDLGNDSGLTSSFFKKLYEKLLHCAS